jgi:replicative DNA helicase
MDLKEKEREVLNLYADNADLFVNCEHLVFENLWSTNFNKVKYKIIKYNHDKGKKSDTYLLSNMLIKAGCNKKEIGLEVSEPNYKIAKNVDEYVKDIFDEYSKRQLTPLLQRVHSELSSELGDVSSCLEDLKTAVNDIESIKNNLSVDKKATDIFDQAFNELMEAQNNVKEIVGYSTGLTDLDKVCGGLKQEVIVVGSPPGSGKSSLMVNIIDNVAIKQGKPVAVFSLEMPATQLMKNMWANNLTINSYAIRGGGLLDEDLLKVKKYKQRLKDNLVIDDTPGITWQYMETRIRKMRKTVPMNELIVVMVDYIQIMRNTIEETRGISSEEQLGLRSNGLMELSKKYNLCMIELSQLSRDVGKRENKKPVMGDLKGSGAIEANAVIIILLYRADYYETDPMDNGMSLKGLCELNIAKNRYGETKRIYVRFEGKYSAFKDYAPDSNDIIKGGASGDEF